MTYDEFIALLNEVVDVYDGTNLPDFVSKIDSVKDAGQFLNQEWVPKEQYDSLSSAFKKRYKEEYFGTSYEEKSADVSEIKDEAPVEEVDDETAEDEDFEQISFEDLI